MTTIRLRTFFRSLRHALHGLGHAFQTENNFRIHVTVSILVVVVSFLLHISHGDFLVVILTITSMLVLELVNTIVERFADLLEPRIHPYVHVIKDLMAATVVVAAASAVIIGFMIFLPYVA